MKKHILWWNDLPIETMNLYKDRIMQDCSESTIYRIWLENGCPEPLERDNSDMKLFDEIMKVFLLIVLTAIIIYLVKH